eukprot:607213_1
MAYKGSQRIRCYNCGASYSGKHQLATGLMGKYCSNCGQQIYMHAYHQTSAADSITSSQYMKCDKKGMAGPGIYMATNPYATNRKAIQKGTVLQADIYLGKKKTISKNGNSSVNVQKVAQQRTEQHTTEL